MSGFGCWNCRCGTEATGRCDDLRKYSLKAGEWLKIKKEISEDNISHSLFIRLSKSKNQMSWCLNLTIRLQGRRVYRQYGNPTSHDPSSWFKNLLNWSKRNDVLDDGGINVFLFRIFQFEPTVRYCRQSASKASPEELQQCGRKSLGSGGSGDSREEPNADSFHASPVVEHVDVFRKGWRTTGIITFR